MAAGALALILVAVAAVLHHRLGDHARRDRATRARRLRAEIVSWSVALPLSVAFATLAFQSDAPRTTEVVAGKPVEVRSQSRQVFMPDGRTYYFRCGSGKNGRNDCPALSRWKALPRWPEPEHVEMEVFGERIYSLRMDGDVIVDREVDNEDKRAEVLMTLGGMAVSCGAIVAIWRRVRRLADLRRSAKRPRRPPAQGSPTPPAVL